MPSHPSRQFETADFRLLHAVRKRLGGRPVTDAGVLDALQRLAEAYDPQRADRLRVRPGEPAALVERLAAFLLRRVPAEAVTQAQRLLDGAAATGSATAGEHPRNGLLDHRELSPCP